MHDVFISYSRKDSEVANRMFEALSAEGITCFIDRQGISGGADFPTVLSEAIMNAKVLLLVASEHSYASEFTQKELTFAVNNKGSRFIFPIIVDNSVLPKNLEFLLSNINWRTLSPRYTIEKEMVADIKRKLADPHAGETLKERERSSVKTMMTIIFIIVGLVALAVGALLFNQAMKNAEDREIEEVAAVARGNCQGWSRSIGELMNRADSLREKGNEIASFQEELSCLDSAQVLIGHIDSVRNYYQSATFRNPAVSMQFASFSTATYQRRLNHKRDSMFTIWSGRAKVWYDIYASSKDDIDRGIALGYVEKALQINPSAQDLQQVKETLTQ